MAFLGIFTKHNFAFRVLICIPSRGKCSTLQWRDHSFWSLREKTDKWRQYSVLSLEHEYTWKLTHAIKHGSAWEKSQRRTFSGCHCIIPTGSHVLPCYKKFIGQYTLLFVYTHTLALHIKYSIIFHFMSFSFCVMIVVACHLYVRDRFLF